VEKEVLVESVDAYKTKSGNTRFVLRDDEARALSSRDEQRVPATQLYFAKPS
jgi:hypothetical protein